MLYNDSQKRKEPLSLKIVNCFRGLFSAMGVDYIIMYKILSIKLLMDGRKTSTVFNNGQLKENSKGIRYELFMNLFLGFFLMLLVVIPGLPILYVMSGLFGTIMLYLSLYMLADFSSVILDIRDRIIIGSRPVSNKTLNMAKIVHISIYLTSTVLSLVILPLGASLIKFGIVFFLIFMVEIISMTVLIMFFTSIIYYILLSILDGEKLKDIINYIQVVFTVVVVIGQQILPRAFSFIDSKITYSFKDWFYFIPPMWMAAPFEMLENGVTHKGYILMALFSICVPIVVLLVYVKYMSPYFESKLVKLSNGENVRQKKAKKGITLTRLIGNKICKDPVERAAYNFVTHMTSSERKFKLQLYPQLALYTIIPWIFIVVFMDSNDKTQTLLEQIRGEQGYFWLYMALFAGSYVLMLISKSENYRAAWIYKVAPSSSPVPILKGTVKAIIVKYNVPFAIVQCTLFIALYGIKIVPDLIVIVLNSLLFLLISFKMLKKQMPFSLDFAAKETSQGLTMGIMAILFLIGVGHLALTSYMPYGNGIIGVISIVAIVVMWRSMFNLTWGDVEK